MGIKNESEFTPRSKSPLSGIEIGPSRKLGPSTQVKVQPKNNQSTDNQPITFLPDGPGYAPGKRIFHTRRSEKPLSITGFTKPSKVAMTDNDADLGVTATKATINPRDAASTHNELDEKVKNPRKQRHSTLGSKKVNPIGGKRKTRKNKKKKK